MQPTTLHVFVSSTWLDLQPERQAVEAALQRLRETKFIGMEYFGSRDETTRQASLTEVDRCQVYVGLFGGRYGSGITEAEYHRARKRSLPCFIYVKDDAAILPEGRETDPEQAARLATLKANLRDPSAHIVSMFTAPDDLAAKVTADLHRWLVDHYLTPRLEQAARGVLPREEAQALLAAIKDLSVLNQELLGRLRAAGYTIAQEERSIAVGQAIGSILITGDYNRVFVDNYERLSEVYIPPRSVFERVHLEHFAGREWLMREVDAFLHDHDRGYFVLEAGAGLGKTTFLAHLVRKRGYIHHFVELAPGPDGIAPGLKNLVAQLVRAWNLGTDRANESLPNAAARPDFLSNLLFEAAHRRDASKPGERIVLVVDALDEAGTPSGQNVLGLPKVLPVGVYLIVSQRPVEVALEVIEGPRRIFRLEASDARNLTDMRAYLEGASRWTGIARALGEANASAAQFVETLLAKCQGVWIYLHYVVREIECGERSPLLLDTLPQGVWQYYAQYWRRWRRQHADTWDEVHLPVLSALAAVQEDLPLGRLCTLAGVAERRDLHPLLEEAWRPFLVISENKESEGDELHYRLYHASLREFLDGRADLTGLTTQERDRAYELANATRQAHARIADRYLSIWGGLNAGLPGLENPAVRDLDDGYGLRHLAAHLAGAQRVEDLHRLLALESAEHHNTWYEVHDRLGQAAVYLADVARAWQSAEKLAATHIARGQIVPSVGLEVRYALITASFRNLAGNIPLALMLILVEKRFWTPTQGLGYALAIGNMDDRTRALSALAPHLPEAVRTEVLSEARAAARVIENEYGRAVVLAALAPHLPEAVRTEVLSEALAAARAIGDERGRARESHDPPVGGSCR